MENKIEKVSKDLKEQAPEIQGDEETLDIILNHLINNYLRLQFKLKISLRELFPEPENRYLKSIWKYGHADISVFRHGELVNIIEPGGIHHLQNDKQRLNDLKKDKLCKLNGVTCLRIMNNVVDHLDDSITRKLFKKFFYSENGLR